MRPSALSVVVARTLDIGQLCHIDRDGRDPAAIFQFGGGLLGQRVVAVPDRDRRAGIQQTARRSARPMPCAPPVTTAFLPLKIDLVGHRRPLRFCFGASLPKQGDR